MKLGPLAETGAVAAALALVAWLPLALVRRNPRRHPGELRIGTSTRPGFARTSGQPVGLGLDELQQGVLVGGSPGAGKTHALTILMRRVPPSVGLLLVDLKGDRSLPFRLGVDSRRVFGLGDRGSACWTPLGSGNPASWRDILMATQEWSEPHYRLAAARYLGAALAALQSGTDSGAVDLRSLVTYLEDPKRAASLLRETDGPTRGTLQRAIQAIRAESSLRSGVVGLGNRLALLADSPATEGRFGVPGIDLDEVLRGERVVFSLPAAEFPDEAPAIAAAVIQSFGAAAQSLAHGDERLRALLVVDEAPRLTGDQLREAVAIGRGAGIGSVIAVQDFADLDYVSPGTREAVETGANTWIVMRQVASAESIANAIGTQATRKRTMQVDRRRVLGAATGVESVRDAEQYVVSPNEIRRLQRGQAIVWRRLRGAVEHVQVDGEV